MILDFFILWCHRNRASQVAQWKNNPICQCRRPGNKGSTLGWEDPGKMATHFQYACFEIPWTGVEPGGLQSMGRKESNMTMASMHAPYSRNM